MTDEQAHGFIERWLAVDANDTQLRLKYIPEFEKVISAKKTAMFLRSTGRLAMMVQLQIAGSGVPLLKP